MRQSESDLVVVADDVGFVEGPVLMQGGGVLYTSIDRGVVYLSKDDTTAEFARTGAGPNGAVEGHDGVVFVAQNGGAWPASPAAGVKAGVQRIDASGSVSALAVDGMEAPNDLAIGPDGMVYVTDPTRNGRRDDGRIWRCDLTTGQGEIVAAMPWYPNGIGFTREHDALYVADTGTHRIVRYPLTERGLGEPETVVQMTAERGPDGFCFDDELNIVIACPGSAEDINGQVQVWSMDGELVDCIDTFTSRFITNVALSGDRRLYVTDSSRGAVVRLDDWPTTGLGLYPFLGDGGAR